MSEIKKVDTLSDDFFKANVKNETNFNNEETSEIINLYNNKEEYISNNDDEDNEPGIFSDIGEEVRNNFLEEATTSGFVWLSNPKNLFRHNINISLTGAETIGEVAFRAIRVVPFVYAVAQPLWEAFKYSVIEGEGMEGIANHKYEITGAAVGGIVSAGVMVVLASNPVGLGVLIGAGALCMAGSIACEKLGAYYDNYDGMPTDYMKDVYFY